MTYDHLIAEIVNQVLKELKQSNKVPPSSSSHPTLPKLIVIGTFDPIQLSPLKGAYELVTLALAGKDCEAVLVTEVSLNLLSQLALGNTSTRESFMIIDELLKGKKVYILEEGITYRHFKQSAPRNLYNLYQSYEERLEQYGITLISRIDDLLLPSRPNKFPYSLPPLDAQVVPSKTISFKGKKLLHESDLTKIYLQGHSAIIVDSKTIITPLAEDFIKSHHLKVIYDRAEG